MAKYYVRIEREVSLEVEAEEVISATSTVLFINTENISLDV